MFFALSGGGLRRAAAGWLAIASIFFYGYWSPRYVLLLIASIVANFAAGRLIDALRQAGSADRARVALIAAIGANLGVLGYYKYANFFVDTLNAAAGTGLSLGEIVLPIGISFFTFTQIAYLVDTHVGKVRERGFVPYALFVTFYPHLIAGPVLHHAEMMPQFARDSTYGFRLDNFLIGVGYFSIGLFKKVVLADGIQPFVGPVFEPDPGYQLTLVEAWGGVLAYTLQLYFDFSGYSDMAIGLSKMLNVDLPFNFDSPYKARNISEFWRRWHMTLSRFLRDYLYIPLGGNRFGSFRRYVNLLTTMLLGGLWHGAGWTFVIWGALHGAYLVVHQLWQSAWERWAPDARLPWPRVGHALSVLLTFLCVVVAWVFFRATTLDSALHVLSAMAGLNGFVLPTEMKPALEGLPGSSWVSGYGVLQASGGFRQVAWIAVLLAIAWWMPNSQAIIAALSQRVRDWRTERPSWALLGAGAVGVFLLAAINGSHGSSEFIYFNF
ncbi:MBOAT family protein [Piscinibacter sp.]|uniref:MBOAT family O-acyltransferase n=1 Tax=Piscinibacter sp. TaxID=1903157 RepID=UPI00258359B5|nr:MBOAT family protein [Piscinibacter sp.]